MKRAMRLLITAAMVAGTVPLANATAPYNNFDRGITLVNTDKASIDIWGRGQMLGVAQDVHDPVANQLRVYEFLKQARLGFNGKVEDAFNFQIEFAYGGENQNTSQSVAGSYDLMDFVADVPVKPLGENTIVKLGQFRVPYGREALQDEGFQDFADRSIATMATNHGRDFGLAIMGTHDKFTGTIGTFPDGGRDIAQRYLPENMGIPEVVARIGYNDGVDADIYHVMGTDRNLKRDTKAIYLNGLFEEDTRIGHSTALLSHSVDNNLLDNTNYNPFLQRSNSVGAANPICSAATCSRGRLWSVGSDAVYRHPLGNGQAIEVEGQVDWGGFDNPAGTLHIAAGRLQTDYQVGSWEIGARYAVLSMDSNAGFNSTTNNAQQKPVQIAGSAGATANYQYTPGMGKPIHEIDPSITYHFKGHAMKVVADLPIFLDAPIFIDHTDGSYLMTDPLGVNEDTVLTASGNSMVRRTSAEARMMFQWQF